MINNIPYILYTQYMQCHSNKLKLKHMQKWTVNTLFLIKLTVSSGCFLNLVSFEMCSYFEDFSLMDFTLQTNNKKQIKN